MRDNGFFERMGQINREDLLSAIASLRESRLLPVSKIP
jgi:hypothetical protein